MNRVLLSRVSPTPDSGWKAKADVRQILVANGFRALDMDDSGSDRRKAARSFMEAPRVLSSLARLGRRDLLVAQYPQGVVGGRLAARGGRAPRVAFIHDVESLRQQGPPGPDIALLRHYDVLIVPTEQMGRWLTERLEGRTPAVVVLGIFDYLTESQEPPAAPEARPSRLIIAGNMKRYKVGWLYGLGATAAPVTAYGPFAEPDRFPNSVTWGGSLDMNAPKLTALDGFGLVWDGKSATELSPRVGDYLRYNAPHKLSFYLAAGVPVLVPEGSAVADFVQKHDIGACVSSVHDAAEFVNACTPARWKTMTSAVARVRGQVLSGHFTRTAVDAAAEAVAVAT